jgi:hypothetical protein
MVTKRVQIPEQKTYSDARVREFTELLGTLSEGYFSVLNESNAKIMTSDLVANKKVADFVIWLAFDSPDIAKNYFSALGKTGEAETLTSNRVFDFAMTIRYEAANYYFQAIEKIGKTEVLTSEKMMNLAKELGNTVYIPYFRIVAEVGGKTITDNLVVDRRVMEFAKALGKECAACYFLAIAKTGAIDTLTSDRIMRFAKDLGERAADDYFWAIFKAGCHPAGPLTGEMVVNKKVAKFAREINCKSYFDAIGRAGTAKVLTSNEVMDFAKQLGNVSWGYFMAIANTGNIDTLTSEQVINKKVADFARELPYGAEGALDYFNAIGSTGAAKTLTSENVMSFAKRLNPDDLGAYFQVIAETNRVDLLTNNAVINNKALVSSRMGRKEFRAIVRKEKLRTRAVNKTPELNGALKKTLRDNKKD